MSAISRHTARFGAPAFTQPMSGSQESAVHSSPSSQFGVRPIWHPRAGLQVSTPLQALLSSQTSAVPTQTPFELVSPVVQSVPSLRGAVLKGFTQPVTSSQLSSVQGLLSSHASGVPGSHAPVAGLQASMPSHTVVFPHAAAMAVGVPVQVPPAHASFSVQRFPSLHGSVFGVNTHPVGSTHASSVQALLSLHTIGVPGRQPNAGVHVSSPSHGFPLSQRTGTPMHAPSVQTSPEVQALSSSHGSVVFTCWQPRVSSQASVVQSFKSSQSGGVPTTHAVTRFT